MNVFLTICLAILCFRTVFINHHKSQKRNFFSIIVELSAAVDGCYNWWACEEVSLGTCVHMQVSGRSRESFSAGMLWKWTGWDQARRAPSGAVGKEKLTGDCGQPLWLLGQSQGGWD